MACQETYAEHVDLIKPQVDPTNPQDGLEDAVASERPEDVAKEVAACVHVDLLCRGAQAAWEEVQQAKASA